MQDSVTGSGAVDYAGGTVIHVDWLIGVLLIGAVALFAYKRLRRRNPN